MRHIIAAAALLGAKQPKRFISEGCNIKRWLWICKHCLTLLLPRCQCCGRWGATQRIGSMTLYPDSPLCYRLCALCADDYEEYWSERWDDYYSSP